MRPQPTERLRWILGLLRLMSTSGMGHELLMMRLLLTPLPEQEREDGRISACGRRVSGELHRRKTYAPGICLAHEEDEVRERRTVVAWPRSEREDV